MRTWDSSSLRLFFFFGGGGGDGGDVRVCVYVCVRSSLLTKLTPTLLTSSPSPTPFKTLSVCDYTGFEH